MSSENEGLPLTAEEVDLVSLIDRIDELTREMAVVRTQVAMLLSDFTDLREFRRGRRAAPLVDPDTQPESDSKQTIKRERSDVL